MADTDDKVDDAGGEAAASDTPKRIAQRKADREGWVPFTRAQRMAENAARTAQETADKRITDLERRVTERNDQPAREYTRVELQGFVEAGRINQNDANALWDQQHEAKVLRNVETLLDKRLTTDNRAVAVQAQVDRYQELVPDMLVPDSEIRQKVEKEFEALVELGQPSHKEQGGLGTELLALRNIFGPAEALRQSRTALQTHQESGARGAADDDDGDLTKDGWPKGMSARQRAYNEDLLRKKIIKSKDEVVTQYARVAKRRGA